MPSYLMCLCGWVAGNAVAGVGPTNLVSNGGFEQVAKETGLPVGWRLVRGATVTVKSDGGHHGDRYVRMVDKDRREGIFLEGNRVPARVGGRYTAVAWMRTSDKGGPGLYINVYDDVGTRIHDVYTRAKGPTSGWVRVEVSTVAPPGAAEVSVGAYSYVADVGTFDFDDVALTVQGGTDPGANDVPRAQPKEKPMVNLDSRLELFVDDFMVADLTGDARRRLHHPERREVVLQLDRPWEGSVSGYFTLMNDDGGYRLYYRGWPTVDKPACTCVAESRDGIHFTRPKLNLFEWEGATGNNIVWRGDGVHNFTPFKDANPKAPPSQRYKALASAGPKNTLVPFVSADGYRWTKLREEPVITDGAFDSQNLAFWDAGRGRYVSFFRDFHDGVRDIKTCTSEDFIHWTKPVWLDYGGAPPEHLYTNAILPYFRAPHLYLGFPCRFVPTRKKIVAHKETGINDGVLMSSRDGFHFQRWLEAFLRPGLDPQNWTDRNNYLVWGMAATAPGELSVYWTEHYRSSSARIRRGTLRTDGFVSIGAGRAGGELLTRPFTFVGSHLVVNYDTSAVGSLRFELCNQVGKPVPGFSLADSEWLYGSEIAHSVVWGDNDDVSRLAGKVVRLRVRLKDGDLYSFRFME